MGEDSAKEAANLKTKLSALDEVLREQMAAACERAGSQKKFAERYDLHISDVSRMVSGKWAVGGRPLRAICAELMGLEPSALDK